MAAAQKHASRPTLHVEYAERRQKDRILLMLILFYEYINLEYVRIYVINRITEAEYVIHMFMAASQEYVKTYSIRRQPTARALTFPRDATGGV